MSGADQVGPVVNAWWAGLTGSQVRGWLAQMERLSGCAAPIFLVGHSIAREKTSGQVVHVFTSASQPYGRLAVPCRNRRAAVCQPCAFLHHGDTYQLIVSGLAGGKGVPVSVAGHPRLLVTLTAPSFGPVHRASNPVRSRQWCRARRTQTVCEHGVPLVCRTRHPADDPLVGTPLCAACYDYEGAVLWNANLGELWHRFVLQVRRELAKSHGLSTTRLSEQVRVSFAKVAECQRRGSVHIHAVVRVDGPQGPGDEPAAWASAEMLADAVRAAGSAVFVRVLEPDGAGTRVLRFGGQLDVRQIGADEESAAVSDQAVAGYVAKYVTKGDLPGLVLPTRLKFEGQIDAAPLSSHARVLMHMCFQLARRPGLESLRLDRWAHQLGFRGHIATKSRAYSTTYAALRSARSEHRRRQAGVTFDPDDVEIVGDWQFDHVGYSPEQAALAAMIAANTQRRRDAGVSRPATERSP